VADQVYDGDPRVRLGAFGFMALLAVWALLRLRSAAQGSGGDGSEVAVQVVIVLLLMAGIAHGLLVRPQRITLTDEGARFSAPLREEFIAWPDLVSVDFRSGQYGGMKWQARDRRPLRIHRRFIDVHRLLTEVERRAPHARVASA
jgi:hypothetical protein